MAASSSLRAALYVRVSTADQSPDLQLDELRCLAAHRGWTIADVFIDLGHSGAKDRRPELDRLMQRVQRGGVDIVVCWRFDRFARSVRHLVIALDEFRARGVDFVSLNDGIDTSTPAGRFTFHVIAAVAELEREMIRERTKAGIAAARRRGKHPGRPKSHVDLHRARQLLAAGATVSSVARQLNCARTTLRRAIDAWPKTSPEFAHSQNTKSHQNS